MKFLQTLYDWLLYLTNNEEQKTRKEWLADERKFDVIFFLTIVFCLVTGIICFLFPGTEKFGWMCMLIIECVWCFDNLRHNRSDE